MSLSREAIEEQLAEVGRGLAWCHEEFTEGPGNKEHLLDKNLPDLYVAIHGLYNVMGEGYRLENMLAAQTSRPTSASDIERIPMKTLPSHPETSGPKHIDTQIKLPGGWKPLKKY